MVKPNFIITAKYRQKEMVFAQTYEKRRLRDLHQIICYSGAKKELDYVGCQNNQGQLHANKFTVRKFDAQTEYTYHVSEWEILRDTHTHLLILTQPEFVPIAIVKNKAFEPNPQKHLVEYIKDSKGDCRLYIGFLDKKIDRFDGEYPSETLCNSYAKDFDVCKTNPKGNTNEELNLPEGFK